MMSTYIRKGMLVVSILLSMVLAEAGENPRNQAFYTKSMKHLFAMDQAGFNTENTADVVINSVVTCPVGEYCPEVDECSATTCPNTQYIGVREELDQSCYNDCQSCVDDCKKKGKKDCSYCYKHGGSDCTKDCTIQLNVWCKYYSAVSVKLVNFWKDKYGIDWGDPDNPNCGGITMSMIEETFTKEADEEFEPDMSEYEGLINSKLPRQLP